MRALVCHRFGDYHDLKLEDIPESPLPPRGSVGKLALSLAD